MVKWEDTEPPLSEIQQKQVQEIVDTLLYYSQAVDPMLACSLSMIATYQTHG